MFATTVTTELDRVCDLCGEVTATTYNCLPRRTIQDDGAAVQFVFSAIASIMFPLSLVFVQLLTIRPR